MWSRIGIITLIASFNLSAQTLVGVSKVDVTPTDFELPIYKEGQDRFRFWDKFYDTGFDRLFDFEEEGALGLDGAPGVAGVDDDGDGEVDECDRDDCNEYLADGSDDRKDPARDNYHSRTNPNGTEGDKKFQYLHVAGFTPKMPVLFENRFATGIHDKIWARGLAVKSDGKTLLMITVDSPGIAWKFINPVKRRLADEFNLPVGAILISSTHDHYAPDGSGYWATLQKNHNKHYTDKLVEWMYQAGKEALESVRPAKMKVVSTKHYSCYNPRTKELKKDPDCNVPLTKGQYDEDKDNEYDEMIVQGDVRDPLVRNTNIVAAQFMDLETNETIGTFINYHNHPDSMGSGVTEISSGYVHYIRKFVEHHLGGDAIYFVGTLGCQIGGLVKTPVWTEDFRRVYEEGLLDIKGNPVPKLAYDVNTPWEHIKNTGYEVGHEIVQALNAEEQWQQDISIDWKTEPIDTEIDNALHNIFTWSTWNFDVEEEDQMLHYKPRCKSRHGCVRSDLSLYTIGNLSMISAPGEIDPAYFLGRVESVGKYKLWPKKVKYPELKGAIHFMDSEHKAVLGQANGYLSYLLPYSDNLKWWRFYHENHYEEFPTTHKHFGDDVGNKWMEMLGSRYRYSNRDIYPMAKQMDAPRNPSKKPRRRSSGFWKNFLSRLLLLFETKQGS